MHILLTIRVTSNRENVNTCIELGHVLPMKSI